MARNKNKSKFIIGLSSTMLGALMITSAPEAHAAEATNVNDDIKEKKVIEDAGYVDLTKLSEEEVSALEADQATSAGTQEEDTYNNAESPELNQVETLPESEENVIEDNTESPDIEADLSELTNTNQTSEDTSTESTLEEGSDSIETTSVEESSENEALVGSETDTISNKESVEEAETPTDASDSVDETTETTSDASEDLTNQESEEKDQSVDTNQGEVEANPVDTSDVVDDSTTKDNTDTPKDALAGDEPVKDSEAGDAPLDEDGLSKTEESSELAETSEGAEFSAGEESKIQTLAAGDAPLGEDGSSTTEGASDLAETEAGAEVLAEENLEISEEKKPQAQQAGEGEETTEPNYAEDEKKIKDYSGEERYRSTQIEQGNGTAANFIPPDEKNKFIDGYRYHSSEPSATSEDKTRWGVEIELDKEKGQRTYTDFYFSNSGNLGDVLDNGNVSANEAGDKIAGGEKDPNYKATSEIKIDGRRAQRNLNLYVTEEDLKHINNKDNTNTTMAWQGKYLKDNPNGLKATEGSSATFSFTVNPWPNENDKLSLIKLNGSHDKAEFVQGQTITTGVKVKNLDENARERLVGQVYHPETGEVVKGAKAYIDENDNVVVKMPDGALMKDANGKTVINEDSIFYKDAKYRGIQNLEVKFFARPRTADEFKAIVTDNGGGFYTKTGAGEETIKHKGQDITIDKQGIDRYDHYNLIGGFELKLDDESNYDIITKDITANKIVTDKMIRLKAGVDKDVKQVDNPNSEAPHKYITSKADNAVDSYLEEEYKDYLIPVEGEKNKYRTEDNWLVEVDPENPQEMKVSTPIGAKKGESLSLAVTHLFTNGSEKNFLIDYVVKEESIEKPNYKSAVTEAGQKVTNTPTNNYTETKPKPVKYELESTSIVDDNGKTWTLSIDEETGEITATAPGEIDKVSTINAPVIATYVDQNLNDINGKDLVYTERSSATFSATAPQEGEVKFSHDNIIEYETKVQYNPEKDPTESGIVQKGKNGKYTADYTVTYKDGDVVEGPTMVEGTERDRVEPIPQIFEIGTKGTRVDVTAPNEQTIKIPHTTEIIYDESQPVGYRKETPGEDGEKKITYEIIQQDGKATVKATETTTKEVTPRKIVIGTKAIETERDTYTNQFTNDNVTINYVDDATMDVGQTREGDITGGEVRTVVESKYNPETGEIDTFEKTEVTPIVKTIYRGTKNFTGTFTHTEEHIIPFETEVVVDPTQTSDEPVVTQEGKNGKQTRTVTQSYINGEIQDDKTISEFKEEEQPTKQIITVRTLTEGTHSKEEEIPFETNVIYDSSIEAGTYEIEKIGVVGKKKTTWTIKNSKITDTKEEIITEKQDALIKVGNKHFEGPVTHTETIELPYDIEIIESNEVPVGTRFVRQEGQKGSVDVTYTQNFKEGKPDGELSRVESNRNNAQNMVVVVGTKAIESTVKPEIKVVEDDTLAAGTVEEGPVTEGKVVTTVEKSTDPLTGKEVTREKTEVTAPTQTIRVGTKAYDGQVIYKEQKVTPFKTEIVFDEALEHGKTETTQEGINKVEERTITQNLSNGTQTTRVEGDFEVVEEGQNQIIRVGTKQDGTYTHTQELPFEYKIVEDSSIQKGKYEIDDSEATKGKVTTTFTIENSVVNEDKTTSEKVAGKPVIIKVGTADFTGTVSHEVTEAIPFEVIIQYDPEMIAGKYEVTQQGEAGSKTTVYSQDVKNGQANGELKVTEDKTKYKAPTTQIVKVGRKAAENTDTSSANTDIEIKFVADNTKEQGSQPETTYTPGTVVNKVVNKYNPETGQIETTTEPQVTKGVIEIKYGTKDYTGEVKYIEKEYIDYSTKVTVDYSLKPNEVVVDTKGQVGIKERNVTQKVVNGKLTDTVRDDYKTTSQPVEQVIRIGADVTAEKPVDKTIEIPFATTIKEDPTKPIGYKNIDTEGVNGSVTITFSEEIKDGKVTVTASEDRKDPITQVVTIGTKAIENVTGSDEEVIEPKVVIEYSDQLEQGKIETKVTNGKANANSDSSYNGDDGTMSNNTEVEVTQPTITVTVGTKPINKTKTEEIPFETEYVFDPTLDVGQQETQTEGQNGSRTITFERTSDGTTITEKEIEVNVTEPTKKVVRVGTKQTVTTEEIETPYDTVIEYDNTKPVGEKEVTKGTHGKKKVTVTTAIDKDGNTESNTNTEVVSEPKNEIITVGTKVTNGNGETTTKVVEVPFETEVITDDNLAKGERVVDQKGEKGERTITVTTPVTNGVAGEPVVTDKVTKDPVKEIIRVGTLCPVPEEPEKPEDKVITSEQTVEVQYDTEIIEDNTLEAGTIVEEKAGENGERTITSIVTVTDGKASAPVINTEVTKQPVKRIVRVGTKKSTSGNPTPQPVVTTEPVDYETVVIYDNTLPEGKTVVEQAGRKGEKRVTRIGDEVVEEITKRPINEIIRVGTKTVDETPTPSPRPNPTPIPTPVPSVDEEETPGVEIPEHEVTPNEELPVVEIPENEVIPNEEPQDEETTEVVEEEPTETTTDDTKETEDVDSNEKETPDISDETTTEESEDSVSEIEGGADVEDVERDDENDSDADKEGLTSDDASTNDEDQIDVIKESNTSAHGNPKTGITGSSSLLAAISLSFAGLAATKKKEDEEDDK